MCVKELTNRLKYSTLWLLGTSQRRRGTRYTFYGSKAREGQKEVRGREWWGGGSLSRIQTIATVSLDENIALRKRGVTSQAAAAMSARTFSIHPAIRDFGKVGCFMADFRESWKCWRKEKERERALADDGVQAGERSGNGQNISSRKTRERREEKPLPRGATTILRRRGRAPRKKMLLKCVWSCQGRKTLWILSGF